MKIFVGHRGVAAQREAAMAVLERAPLDHHVLAGSIDAQAVGIYSRLDRNAVVAFVESAVLDQHISARVGVAAIRVLAGIIDR